ncbi:hypothetical protein [Streptomyces brasiliensis]|uniref:Uncharacterized protein n=1 Tax=Streptomyces brasiliensis TaxID=1954 RepID=A0A917NVD5_9ACTN|nr:hypothetical protein [Streptomyces brasiliensis]GGJ31797.1 hypothetical protein GCM10010121_048790 [Streptomyces brasiliensis]
MADYATHTAQAAEHLESVERSRGRLSDDQRIAMAEVEALLALATAINGRRGDVTGH